MLSTVDTMDVASARQNASSDLKKTPKGVRSPDHVFTLGIEEELQIIDPETRELRCHIQQILARQGDLEGANQTGDAPVDRGNRHRDLQRCTIRATQVIRFGVSWQSCGHGL